MIVVFPLDSKEEGVLKSTFFVIKPMEDVLSREENSFQNVSILKSIKGFWAGQIFGWSNYRTVIWSCAREGEAQISPTLDETFHNGTFTKTNELFPEVDLIVVLIFYANGFWDMQSCLHIQGEIYKSQLCFELFADVNSWLGSDLDTICISLQGWGWEEMWLQYCVGATVQRLYGS